jgi:thiol:disulfide interchange protein DsbD
MDLAAIVEQRGFLLALPFVFVGGLLLNLTPCVFPMIPVTLSFFASQAAQPGRRYLAKWLAVSYVLGLACTYALLGLAAARTGALFGAWLQLPAVRIAMAAVLAALALSMFGVYELRVPQAVMSRLGAASAGLGGAFMMGALLGIVAAPCVGPFLAGLLLLVSQLQNPAIGFLLFLVLGLGMGAPYLALGMAAQQVRKLPKAGGWLTWVKEALGVVLLGVALFFLAPTLPERSAHVAAATLLAGAGAFLGWLAPASGQTRAFKKFRQAAGSVLLVVAAAVIAPRPASGPSVAWIPYSHSAVAHARSAQHPVLVDVYADWCLPCVEMEHTTFRQPGVLEALSGVAALRIDATEGVDQESEEFLKRYQVFGAPTMLFFDRRGEERADLRLMRFATAEEIRERIRQLQKE